MRQITNFRLSERPIIKIVVAVAISRTYHLVQSGCQILTNCFYWEYTWVDVREFVIKALIRCFQNTAMHQKGQGLIGE